VWLLTDLPAPAAAQVETYYTNSGFMLPNFHRFYWMGLVSSSGTWPRFTWVDNRTPGPSNSSIYYNHWGRFKPSKEYEPNNLITPPELCGGANASEAYGSPATWGWADWNCTARFPIMCKMQPPLVARCEWEGHSYLLNTSYSNQKQAETSCQANGGHLVGYDALAEQVAVENCFIGQGFLLPKYHVLYWMGLVSGMPGAQWPNFTWIDHNDAIYRGNYQHWGISGKDLEPNNLLPPETCAGSNLTVWYTNCGGWADHNCKESYVYICEIGSPLAHPAFTSQNGNSFTLYTTPADFDTAQATCNAGGGHLASYADLQEQVSFTLECPSADARCMATHLSTVISSCATTLPSHLHLATPLTCCSCALCLQYDVEAFYTEKGWLLPSFHKSYWIGLKTSQWPTFRCALLAASVHAGTCEAQGMSHCWSRMISTLQGLWFFESCP
jgi:hypothetical protein